MTLKKRKIIRKFSSIVHLSFFFVQSMRNFFSKHSNVNIENVITETEM